LRVHGRTVPFKKKKGESRRGREKITASPDFLPGSERKKKIVYPKSFAKGEKTG